MEGQSDGRTQCVPRTQHQHAPDAVTPRPARRSTRLQRLGPRHTKAPTYSTRKAKTDVTTGSMHTTSPAITRCTTPLHRTTSCHTRRRANTPSKLRGRRGTGEAHSDGHQDDGPRGQQGRPHASTAPQRPYSPPLRSSRCPSRLHTPVACPAQHPTPREQQTDPGTARRARRPSHVRTGDREAESAEDRASGWPGTEPC